MCLQTFILRMRLPQGMTHEEAAELLGAADCTEPLVGVGEPGHLALVFHGPVELSEIADVARAIPAAVLLNFGPNGERGAGA